MKTVIRTAACVMMCAPFSSAMAFCGFYAGKADSSLFNEASQVIIARDGNKTVLSMLNDYKGALNEFALIVPTPVVLKQGQVRIADKGSFEKLDAFTSPRLAEYHDPDPCKFKFEWGNDASIAIEIIGHSIKRQERESASPVAILTHGVKVEARYTLEEYDIVSLSAKDSDGLEIWLHENGYTIPKGTSAALKPYINQGMKFFVAKVNLKEQLKTGYTRLRPLQFAFESEKFMLPMRLGMLNAAPDKTQDLIVYTLTRRGRVESSNYRTANLPTDMEIPYFMKPKFKEFYKAMFDQSAKKEDFRVVFTEYFWDMAWCDPCSSTPLTRDELRDAGMFWVDGDAEKGFQFMQQARQGQSMSVSNQWSHEALVTRMHVRYTPNSFPEDLMFTQTQDKRNWQSRYVIHNPYAGGMPECRARLDKIDCTDICKEPVDRVYHIMHDKSEPAAQILLQQRYNKYRGKTEAQLQRNCIDSCFATKENSMRDVASYYLRIVPERVSKEKLTLANLTGWSMQEIDALPGAQQFPPDLGMGDGKQNPAMTAQNANWWQKLLAINEKKAAKK
ncbi:DUF2330 domain-containing protein [Undibacterium sp. Di27W]